MQLGRLPCCETLGGLVISAVIMGAIPTGLELVGAAIVLAGATIAILGARPAAAQRS